MDPSSLSTVLGDHPTALTVIALAAFVASILDALVPQPAANSAWLPLRKALSALAVNVGNASNAGQPSFAAWAVARLAASAPEQLQAMIRSANAALPPEPAPTSSPSSSAATVSALLLALVLAVPLAACSTADLAKFDAAVAADAATVDQSVRQVDAAVASACDAIDKAIAVGQSIAPAVNGLAALVGSKAVPATEAAAATVYQSFGAFCAAARAAKGAPGGDAAS